MLNHGLGLVRVLIELEMSRRQCFNALIPRWPTVGRVAFTVVRLVTLDCTRGTAPVGYRHIIPL